MQNNRIIEILQQWNFWQKEQNVGVKRAKYANELFRQKDLKEISVITGARRSGKSTILLQTLRQLIDSGVPASNILYINFEEPAFAAELNLPFLLQIYDAFLEHFAPTGKIFIALDEAAQVPQWEKFARGLYDRRSDIKFFVTDSSSRLLSPEYGSVLTGRTLTNIVYPLSFNEFMEFNGLSQWRSAGFESGKLRYYFRQYLEWGGFPQVVLTESPDDKNRLLKEYYTAIVEKDMANRHHVRNLPQLKEFCLFAMQNNGLPFSGYIAEKKQDISQPTANKFIDYLNEVYLMSSVNYFSYSFAKQQKNPKKIYSIDTGIYNATSFRFSENIGRVFENAVFLSLRRAGAEVFYWQGENEVDFLIRRGRQPERLINVCWQLGPDNLEREIDGLKEAMREFNLSGAEIIAIERSDDIKNKYNGIEIKDFFSLPGMIGN